MTSKEVTTIKLENRVDGGNSPDRWDNYELDSDVKARVLECARSGLSLRDLLEMSNNDASFVGSYNDWFREHFSLSVVSSAPVQIEEIDTRPMSAVTVPEFFTPQDVEDYVAGKMSWPGRLSDEGLDKIAPVTAEAGVVALTVEI